MKLFIVSDIHGNVKNTNKVIELFKESLADYLIILGDLYHGGLWGSSQDARDIANALSHVCTKLYLLKGNCDWNTDEDYSPVGFKEILRVPFGKRYIYFAHGHRGIPMVEFKPGDVYCYGHTHINDINRMGDVIFCNPGSVSLPRGLSKASYMIIDEAGIKIYDFNNQVIKEHLWEE